MHPSSRPLLPARVQQPTADEETQSSEKPAKGRLEDSDAQETQEKKEAFSWPPWSVYLGSTIGLAKGLGVRNEEGRGVKRGKKGDAFQSGMGRKLRK